MTTMKQNGLAKLVEECGEVQQVAGKMIQYPHLQFAEFEMHPSGYNLRRKMEEEIGDALASMEYIVKHLSLNASIVDIRRQAKLKRFESWGNSNENGESS